MKRNRLLDLAVTAVSVALLLMLVSLAWPTPRTLALFFGAGLSLGTIGVLAFGLAILRDLHRRRVL